MNQPIVDEQVMRRYLLGELPEEEKQAFEEHYFGDRDVFERLQALEDELIHDYVRDDLPAPVRAQFEKHFLISRERRRRVALTEEYMQALDGELARNVAVAPATSWWQSVREFLRFSNPAFRYAIAVAAVVLLMVHSTRLMLESGRLHDELSQFQAERVALQKREQSLQQRLSQQQNQNTNLTQQLEQERNLLRQFERKLNALKRPPAPITSFAFTPPDAARGVGETPTRLVIQPKADSVRFQLNFKSGKDYDYLRVTLEADYGRELWRQDIDRHTHYAEGRKAVVMMLPATILSPGDYKITLAGADEAGEFEAIEFYKFSVEKK
jgi:anti-sigma factor RsiW